MRRGRYRFIIVASLLMTVALFLNIAQAKEDRDNLALGKPVEGMTDVGGKSKRPFENLTNGNLEAAEYTMTITGNGPQWLQVDLEESFLVDKVILWHYYADNRTYHSNKIAISITGKFEGEEVVVFDTDASDDEYPEAQEGFTLELDTPVPGRYVRNWTDGSTANGDNHWVEMEVYGEAYKAVNPSGCLAKTWGGIKGER